MVKREIRKFTCACCKEEHLSAWTEEEAIQEKNELFGDMPLDEMAKVCTDCFDKIMKYNEHAGF